MLKMIVCTCSVFCLCALLSSFFLNFVFMAQLCNLVFFLVHCRFVGQFYLQSKNANKNGDEKQIKRKTEFNDGSKLSN